MRHKLSIAVYDDINCDYESTVDLPENKSEWSKFIVEQLHLAKTHVMII